MDRTAGMADSAAMVLGEGVRLLHQEPGMFDAMIEGWRRPFMRSLTATHSNETTSQFVFG